MRKYRLVVKDLAPVYESRVESSVLVGEKECAGHSRNKKAIGTVEDTKGVSIYQS